MLVFVLPGILVGIMDESCGGVDEVEQPEHPANTSAASNEEVTESLNARWEKRPMTLGSCVCANKSM